MGHNVWETLILKKETATRMCHICDMSVSTCIVILYVQLLVRVWLPCTQVIVYCRSVSGKMINRKVVRLFLVLYQLTILYIIKQDMGIMIMNDELR
jgi:hypothetical protein